jgi:hypothetical protein
MSKHKKHAVQVLLILTLAFADALLLGARATSAPSTVPVRMTVTANVPDDKRAPEISQDDINVTQSKNRVEVTGWTPARGDRGGLDLVILIDDACDPRLGGHLDELRSFITNQPEETAVAVGYANNSRTQLAQNFTTDHAAAAKSLRMPTGNVGAFGSPYLSLNDLMNRWPAQPYRREVILITDGIDRARGGPRSRLATNPDVRTSITVAQRTGTIVHTIYAPGSGRLGRNYWEENNGQNGISQLSDETGGESYFLGFQNPVSLKPYLDDIQRILANQYVLAFAAKPGTKAGLQFFNVDTAVAGVDLSAPDAAWVPAAPKQ